MSEWISVSYRLPPEDQEVLCSDKSEIFIASQRNGVFVCDCWIVCVTHWQVLPPPPAEGE